MNKFISMVTVAVMTGFAGIASAECVQEGSCFDTFQGISLGGSASFGGYGAGAFTGEEGGVLIEKTGYGGTDTALSVTGDLCGTDCQSGSLSFDAWSGEHLNVTAGALGTTSGDTVSVINEGYVYSGATFEYGKINIEPAAQ